MPSLIFLLTRRYLTEARAHHTLNSMVKICFLAICLAAGSIALIVSIMNGFENATTQTLKGIHADAQIESHYRPIDQEAIKLLSQSPFVYSLSPYKTSQGMLSSNAQDKGQPIAIKALNPIAESKTTILESTLLKHNQRKPTLHELLKSGQIIIGHKLAEILNVQVGDILDLYYAADRPRANKLTLDKIRVTLAGLFKTGIEEFDAGMIICSLDFFDELFDEEIHSIALKLSSKVDPAQSLQELKKLVPYTIYSWIELYPPLQAALQMERYAMIGVLLLIAVICTITIIALMFMFITHKKTDLAILRSMGCPISTIKLLFLLIAGVISFCATACGLLLAWIIGRLLQTVLKIPLPDAYFTSHLPIELDFLSFFVIGISIIILSLCAAYYSLRSIEKLPISTILR